MSSEVSKLHPAIVATAWARLRGSPTGEIAHLQTGVPL